jgi:hypothetical protein
MPNLTEMERRNYEQRLARLEDIALRLSGELFMEGADPIRPSGFITTLKHAYPVNTDTHYI